MFPAKALTSPTALVILDGFGYRTSAEHNAIRQASIPNLTHWWQDYPHAILHASGTAVGLPDGYSGNSEVGHLAIGTGRIIKQPLTHINEAIADGSLLRNPLLAAKFTQLAQSHRTLHIMGLLSDAGVHSTMGHLKAFLQIAHQHGIKTIYIHAFLDGRDVPPRSANYYLEALETMLTPYSDTHIGSLHGRFYAMDRDNHWERTEQSYRILTQQTSHAPISWRSFLQQQYEVGITDEYISPTSLDPQAYIHDGDGILFFNTRPDRARQLTAAFVDPGFSHFSTQHIQLACFITPISYADSLNTDVLIPQEAIYDTLKDTLAHAGKRIFSIAETEKYAHITYFFTGRREEPVENEMRILIPSISVENYINYPCMSAPRITHKVVDSLTYDPYDFYLINYANADMVGHSGNLEATIKAIECLDTQLKKLYDVLVQKMNGTLIITADHGKAEDMFDAASRQPRTSHTAHPVPFMIIKKGLMPGTLPVHELKDIRGYIEKTMSLI